MRKSSTLSLMAKSRPHVIGHLERVASTAIARYRDQLTDLLDGQHGIYALYKNDRLYYVGLATDLRRRIDQHDRDRHKGKWNRFSLYRVRKLDHIREIESLVLRIASPRGNRTGGRLGNAIDLRKQLRKSMEMRARLEIESLVPLRRQAKESNLPRKRALRAWRTRREKGNNLRRLNVRFLAGKTLHSQYKGKSHRAKVSREGGVYVNGSPFSSLSAAGASITGRATNGWRFWRIREKGKLTRLSEIKKPR